MHIPESMLQGSICPVTAVIGVVGVVVACHFAGKVQEKPSASRFGAIAALIFAGQLMNFPIMHGTSGHLLGGVLASSVLGTPFGVLAMAVVAAIQSLVFSDGGVSVLGANLLNMAFIGAGVGGVLRLILSGKLPGNAGRLVATAVSAWMSVVLAAFAVAVELTVDGQIAFFEVVPAMLGTHSLIGLGEVAITLAGCTLVSEASVAGNTRGKVAIPFVTALLVAMLLSPFASGLPDGLEWVARNYGFLHESAPVFVTPLADYSVPLIGNEALSTGLAGAVGVLLTFALASMILRGVVAFSSRRTIS